MSSPAPRPLVLTRRLPDGTVEWVPLELPHRLTAEPGTDYALIDRADYEAPETLVVHRQGEDLVLEVEGNEVVVLEGFFTTADAAFYPSTNIAGGAGPFTGTPVTPDSPLLAGYPEDQQVIWSAEDDRIARVDEAEPIASSSGDGGRSGMSPLLLGGLVVGGLGLAAAAGGGGGGGGGGGESSSGSGGGGTTTPPPPVQRTVDGSVLEGLVIEGNGLTVTAFQANGTSQLGEARVASDGSVAINIGTYTGVVFVRVTDANGGDDYLDEASLGKKDLNAALSAVRTVNTSDTTVLMNINPLTTLAASLASREAGGAAPTPTQVSQANSAIAALFGLSDLHTVTVIPINGSAYDSSDGLSAGEAYGAMLAAFSGATLDNGGNSQQTIDDVLAGLTLSGGVATLSDDAQALLVQGAQTTETQTGENLSDFVSSVLDTISPAITSGANAATLPENSGAGQVVYTAIATDASPVTFSLKTGADAAAFSIDSATGAVTLTANPDFEAKSSYTFTVLATDVAGNVAEQAVSLSISNQDDSAPFITSGATATPIDENSGAGRLIYTATATDTGTVTWSLKPGGDAADFTINPASGAVTLRENPNHETQSSYRFTVVATDNESNTAEQPVTLTINDLDDTAPIITSGGTAAAINENSGANQAVYTAVADDSADVSGGVTFSLRPVADGASFSIDANTGVVRLTANPNQETKASYSFSVVATDAAGNASAPRPVTLSINDLDEVAPNITSGATAPVINENSGAGQVVYTVTSTDTGDVSTGSTSYSLRSVADGAAFSINSSTGAVILTANPNFEAKASYSFTVAATDTAGNSSERVVSLAIANLDEVPPTVTSGPTAPAITENSGANQVVYTATATDSSDISGGFVFSFSPVGDFAAFSINANTGVVRLTANPDFENKSSYAFSVVATDAAGNSSSPLAVSLTIVDIADETTPTVSGVALTSTTGAQNNTLNAGDVVTVTVTMSENVIVDTTGGTPRVALNIGSSTEFATYTSGSGSTTLAFQYTVQPGDADNNGISIPANAVAANGGTLEDATGNTAILGHSSVGNNALFLVDTSNPVLNSSTPADNAAGVAVGANIVLTFSEAVQAGSGNITLSDGAGDTRVIAVNSGQVGFSGNTVTINPTTDLNPSSTYNVQIPSAAITDAAGNPYAGITNSTTLNFETADTIAPVLNSSTPADNATGVAVGANIVLTFSEAVQAGSGNITLSDGAGDTRVIAINSAQVDISGSTVTINPTSDLDPSSTYNVQIPSGAITDAAGNPYAGITNSTTLNFTTADTIAPVLNSSTPADNATGVAVGANIVLTFSEAVQAGSGNITLSDGAGDTRVIAVNSGQVGFSGNTVTINPTTDLNPDSTYYVQIASGAITDAAGNPYAGITNTSTLNFDTEPGVDTSIVVFDLLQGSSSDHSGRTFSPGVSYDIYIRVDSEDSDLSTSGDGPGTWGTWSGAANLDSDDRIILVGDGSAVLRVDPVAQVMVAATQVAWQQAATNLTAAVLQGASFTRITDTDTSTDQVTLFDTSLPGAFLGGQGGALGTMHLANMPGGILTSQGLV